MAIATLLALTEIARAATITVDSLADTGAPGICVLRDAITAANTMTATNGCVAGDGTDTIQFSVTGMIALSSTLPQITDGNLTINDPASPGIALDGSGGVQVMTIASGATVNLNHLIVAHGLAGTGNFGGGIFNFGTLTVINSTFTGNSAAADEGGGEGGGIFNFGTLTVINSTFTGNSASVFGGGIDNVGTLTITNSTFTGNSAGVNGGGIDNAGTLTITNSTFTGNSALGISNGGGGIDNGGTLTITNSTFTGNSAIEGGGAVSNEFLASLKSTILAASSRGSNCFTSFGGIITDAGYNISDDNSCEFSATGSHNNTDPQLDPAGLRNNGGPTQTIALLSGSPAIDAIPLADCTDQSSPPNPIITDQRLFPRPDSGETNCDIGAYEFQDIPFIPFSRFHGGLKINPDMGLLLLSSGFKLGSGGSIDPTTQPVAFGVGSYAIRLPVGSFVKYKPGYVYQKKVNGIFLCIFIKFTDTPGTYRLLVYRKGGILPIGSVPVTLTIGNNSGSTVMNAKFD